MYYASPQGATPEQAAQEHKRHNRFVAGFILFLLCIPILCCLATVCHGQSLPDAPQPQKTCGPKWAGGCYVYGQGKTNIQTLKDPYFLWPTVAEWAFTGADIGITVSSLGNGKGCTERNTFLGPHPTNAEVIWKTVTIEGVVTLFRFAAAKSIPKEPHTKVEKVANWISPALAGFSVYKHGNGIRQWVQTGCM